MTQYCRYCSQAILQDDDVVYCEAMGKTRTRSQITRTNKCKWFKFNPVDVLYEKPDYKPREPRKKNMDGQVSFLR